MNIINEINRTNTGTTAFINVVENGKKVTDEKKIIEFLQKLGTATIKAYRNKDGEVTVQVVVE